MSGVPIPGRHLERGACDRARGRVKPVRGTDHEIKGIVRELRVVKDAQECLRITAEDRVLLVRNKRRDLGAGRPLRARVTHFRAVRMITVHVQTPGLHPVPARDLVILRINETVCHVKRVPGTRHVKDRFRVPVRVAFYVPEQRLADRDAAHGLCLIRNFHLLRVIVINLALDRVPVGRPSDLSVRGTKSVRFPFETTSRGVIRKPLSPRLRPRHGIGPIGFLSVRPEQELPHGMNFVVRQHVLRDILRLGEIYVPGL